MSLLSWTYEGSNDERKGAEDGRQRTHTLVDAVYDRTRGGPANPRMITQMRKWSMLDGSVLICVLCRRWSDYGPNVSPLGGLTHVIGEVLDKC